MNIKNILNHPKGSITVFLTLLFTMLLSVVFITLQSAHYQCSKSFCDGITCTAEESALGHFYLPLFEDYSLFSVPMPDPVFTDLLSDYVQQNISSPVESLYYQLFSCSSYSVTPLKIYHLSDLDGKIFLSQIINAMKYQATGDSLDFLLSIGNLEDISKDYADISAVSPDSTEVPDKYDLSSFSSDPVSDSELPQELQMLIAQKTSAPFKMTYSTDENLYITVGYGPQEGGGYSISVNELYLTGNSIVIDTELKGPETGENTGTESSSPYIVVKTELLDLPVVFR